MDPWDAVGPDREAFAKYLAQLEPADWKAESWCAGWSVKDVAAHLLVPTMSRGGVFFSFLTSGFNLDKMNAKYISKLTASMTTAQIVAKTRETAGVRTAPPGLAPIGVLNELAMHSMDISRAINKPFSLPTDHYVLVVDHMKGVQPVIGCRDRIAGVSLKATDSDWSTGTGPVVEGPTDLLLAAMSGRKAALASLEGPGIETLASR